MSLHESPLEQRPSTAPRLLGWFTWPKGFDRRALADRTSAGMRAIRRLNPIVAYRAIALALAIVVILTHLHAPSSIRADFWIILVAVAHVLATAFAAPRLAQQSDAVNALAIGIDLALCVWFLSLTDGWQGPFWLYAISAVFWPSVRFTLRGAVVSVVIFDSLVVAANLDLIRSTIAAGFGGDLAARGVIVMIVAGAIAMTAQAVATVRRMAVEAERNRIARDLHDGVGKTMGGISLEARSLAQWIERDTAEAGRRARYVARISERAANEVRDVIRSLRQTQATTPLFPSVRALVMEWERETDVPVRLQLNGYDAQVPVLIHNEIVRMLTELLTNVAQHADARDVRVRLTLSSAGVTLSVRDNGRGFDRTAVDPWSGEGHFGLLGTRERTSMLGGLCRITSSPGNGTDVTVDLPMATRDDRSGWLASLLRPTERLS